MFFNGKFRISMTVVDVYPLEKFKVQKVNRSKTTARIFRTSSTRSSENTLKCKKFAYKEESSN